MTLFDGKVQKQKAYVPKEHDEQATVCDYLDRLHLLYFAIPNYRALRGNWAYYRYLLAEGFKVGVPDIFVCEPRGTYNGLFIEMKSRKGGEVTADQQRWQHDLTERGYKTIVCEGAAAAIAAIQEYLRE